MTSETLKTSEEWAENYRERLRLNRLAKKRKKRKKLYNSIAEYEAEPDEQVPPDTKPVETDLF